MIVPLAQTSSPSAVYLWIAILIAVVFAGGIVTAVIRKRLLADDTPDGLILDDIRRLHREGQLSDEEYERLRASIIGESAPGTPGAPIRPKPRDSSERRAAEGFDLTGEPLPDFSAPPDSPPSSGH